MSASRHSAWLRGGYALACLALFAVEVAIARGGIGGHFVRASLGDLLVIVLVYTFARALFLTPPLATAVGAVLLGFVVEVLQYFHLAERLGLKPGEMLYIAMGNTFQAGDLLMYLLGGGVALLSDLLVLQRLSAIIDGRETAPTERRGAQGETKRLPPGNHSQRQSGGR